MGSKSKRVSMQQEMIREIRRNRFIARYNANPCNFLPGGMLTKLYKMDVNQKQLETLAGQVIFSINEHRKNVSYPLINWPSPEVLTEWNASIKAGRIAKKLDHATG
jgi:pyruvate/oxaloacetate carboxyltransferase